MKLIGLMLVRNEQWILGASLRTALKWCDEMVVVDTGSWDNSNRIINEVTGEQPYRIHYSRMVPTKTVAIKNSYDGVEHDIEQEDLGGWWNEMDVRQHSLQLGRRMGGTHFAMVDADEILTANLISRIYDDIGHLKPGQVIDYPMLAMRRLDAYQDDGSIWSGVMLSTAFMDRENLTWRPDGLGYHFHHRCPYGIETVTLKPVQNKWDGGIMHLQFADQERLRWKHRLYKMIERLRWPGRDTVEQVNWRYSLALEPAKRVTQIPHEWYYPEMKERIDIDQTPWHKSECRRLWDVYGPEPFKGLDLWGWPEESIPRKGG